MTTRPSYPYLDVARRYGVDYGLVLSYADALDYLEGPVLFVRLIYWQDLAMRTLDASVRTAVRVARAIELDAQAAVQTEKRP